MCVHVFLGRWTTEVSISESVSKKCFNYKSTETQNRQETAKWVRVTWGSLKMSFWGAEL